MGPKRHQGPTCPSRGHDGIDAGTLCRQESPSAKPTGADFGVLDWIGDKGRAAGGYLWRHTKSVAISLIDFIPVKPDSPYSTKLLKHYVEGSGEPYELGEIPKEWQDWIVKTTGGRPGLHKELSPYNVRIYDLQNSLGHFDVRVSRNKDATTTYAISDVYKFGFKEHDKTQRGRHGFPLGKLDNSTMSVLKHLLPSDEYRNPGGFKERWEIKKVGKETILFIPQQFLVEEGREFPVRGHFAR
jgi:hypothetical protein